MTKPLARFGGLISSIDLDDIHLYACSEGQVQVWDRASMQCVATWPGLGRGIRICVDQDRIYATSLYPLTVIDKSTWAPLYEAQFGSDVSSDLGHPLCGDHHVYFPIRNGIVVAVDKQDYSRHHRLTGHAGTVWGMAQDEAHLYTGSVDTTVRVWSKATLESVRVLTGHRGNVQRVHLAGRYLVSAATDLSVRVWDRESGEAVHRISNAHRRAINGLTSWRGLLLTSSMAERKVRIWEMGSWKLHKEMELSLSECAGVRVAGNVVYLTFRREPGVQAVPAPEFFG